MFLSPDEIVSTYPEIGAHKAETPAWAVFCKSVLGGMFVACAAFAAHIATTLIADSGAAKLIGALMFPGGLLMILLSGAELFTGNCMLPLAVARGRVSVGAMLKNWALVLSGNFVGGVFIAWLSVMARPGDTAFVAAVLYAAEAKASLTVPVAFVRGVLCNILVCAGVWCSYSARSASGKLIASYFPVAFFVLCGTEHCVANSYYFPAALFAGGSELLSWGGFLLKNFIPVTLGNIVGGAVVISGLFFMALFPKKETLPMKETHHA